MCRQLGALFELVSLHLQVGFDLAYSWPASIEAFSKDFSPDLLRALQLVEGEGLTSFLARLGGNFPLLRYRIWFQILGTLYSQGAPLAEACRNIAATLRAEEARGWEEHCRSLPARSSVILLLFFFPPTFLLLFSPLVLGILSSF